MTEYAKAMQVLESTASLFRSLPVSPTATPAPQGQGKAKGKGKNNKGAKGARPGTGGAGSGPASDAEAHLCSRLELQLACAACLAELQVTDGLSPSPFAARPSTTQRGGLCGVWWPL